MFLFGHKHYFTFRKGTQFGEVWQDGQDFKEIEESLLFKLGKLLKIAD